jgi:hypothetical protein
MSWDQDDIDREVGYERLYRELGPQWAEEHRDELYQEAIQEFTAERLRSYYVSHPQLVRSAYDSLTDAEALRATHAKAAVIFATTAVELGIKVLLLQPIVFGLVHTEALAELITDLTIQQAGMDRFQALLAEILKQYGGVDLKTFTRSNSTKTLWQEIGDLQKVRNRVIHRGEMPEECQADLGVEVAGTVLRQLFPQVLRKLGLHLHDSLVICGDRHTTRLQVAFTIPGYLMKYVTSWVEVDLPVFNFLTPTPTISGELTGHIDPSDLAAMRSAPAEAYMHIVSVPVRYQVQFNVDSTNFVGTLVAWS